MDKIICVGKNYLKHAIELGDAVPEEPILFMKPPSTIFTADHRNPILELPKGFDVHHEVELVLRIDEVDSELQFTQYTFGLDLTLRDLQSNLKKLRQPWEKAKVFKNSSVLGPWEAVTNLNSLLTIPFELKVSGQVRQSGRGEDMRWKPKELLTEIQKWFPIKPGDLLFTGTPEGVGPLRAGDLVEVSGGTVAYNIVCQ